MQGSLFKIKGLRTKDLSCMVLVSTFNSAFSYNFLESLIQFFEFLTYCTQIIIYYTGVTLLKYLIYPQVSGKNFYSTPRVSQTGTLAWIQWDHPNMVTVQLFGHPCMILFPFCSIIIYSTVGYKHLKSYVLSLWVFHCFGIVLLYLAVCWIDHH